MAHNNIQRFFIIHNNELFGTNSLKGFTKDRAEKKAEIYSKLYKGKKFKVVEVVSSERLEQTD